MNAFKCGQDEQLEKCDHRALGKHRSKCGQDLSYVKLNNVFSVSIIKCEAKRETGKIGLQYF